MAACSLWGEQGLGGDTQRLPGEPLHSTLGIFRYPLAKPSVHFTDFQRRGRGGGMEVEEELKDRQAEYQEARWDGVGGYQGWTPAAPIWECVGFCVCLPVPTAAPKHPDLPTRLPGSHPGLEGPPPPSCGTSLFSSLRRQEPTGQASPSGGWTFQRDCH